MIMNWTIIIANNVDKSLKKLPEKLSLLTQYLVHDLTTHGALIKENGSLRYTMSAHTKKHPIKTKKSVLCVSEQGQVYRVPAYIISGYLVANTAHIDKKIFHSEDGVSPQVAFQKINAKYSKTGALLKGIRLREGLNQKDFAALIKVTQGDLSKMERGLRPIGKILAARIAKKFGSLIV